LLRREKKETQKEERKKMKKRKENVWDKIECGRLLDFAIEGKIYLNN
jgi:hypothetical protein